MSRLPLEGIRILDFTLIWAGPYAVMLLSDLGAEVIRVESCQHHITNTRGFSAKPSKDIVASLGALGRLYVDQDPSEDPWNRHALFNSLGRNRYSMTVDLTRPDGQEIVRELVKISDVIIDNNSVGLLDRQGLDYPTVHALNPTLIYIPMPVYGLSGPYRNYIGFGANAEGVSGVSSMRGYLNSDPTTQGGTYHMDASSGIGAAYATLIALYERDRTGKGQLVEFPQMEHMIHQIGGPLMDAAMNGRAQTAIGNRDAVRAPQGIYACKGVDKWIAISVGTDDEWAGLCKLMRRPRMASAPEYEGNIARQARHDDIDRIISEWTTGKDAAELAALLQKTGVPAGHVANDEQVYNDKHLEERGFFQWMDHPSCGRHRYPGFPFNYADTPLRFDRPAPCLGEHNELIYSQLLGLPSSEIERLSKLGHIGDAYSDEAIRTG